jgi:hypothetical protein
MLTLVEILLLAVIPGALIFRLPLGSRSARAALAFEERAFWAVAISLVVTTCAGLVLATFNRYDFITLIWVDAAVAAVAAVGVVFSSTVRLGPHTARPTWTVVLPLLLVLAGWWINFRVPPAEYVIGGRDPGIYMNEGVRIAQRGGVKVADEVVSTVPQSFRPLFFPQTTQRGYFSNRFMGFFLLDPVAGTVVGQFPHGFPLWVAIGYGLNGLTGARAVPAVCGILGILAVYFAGARLAGRTAAFCAAALLAVDVAQIWYSRYPSAEIVLQPVVFTALLALTRATRDQDRFFAPLAAVLLVVAAFTHLTGAMVVGLVAAAAFISMVVFGVRVSLWFWLPLVAGTAAAGLYLWKFIPPYFEVPLGFLQNLRPVHLAGVAAGLVAALAGLRVLRGLDQEHRLRWSALALSGIVAVLATYAWFVRAATPTLAVHDADSLRTFTAFYLSPAALIAAVIGVSILGARFTDTSPFLLLVAGFSVLFFYKIRIVPEHFWAARRFLAVILPGMLLCAGAAAFSPTAHASGGLFALLNRPGVRAMRAVLGIVLVASLGLQFTRQARPLLHHVEYGGLIPHLEQLAALFHDDDLVLVESRAASDAHVLALPLSYIYARNVLVFSTSDPPKGIFREFLTWALRRYKRVFFVGGAGGGTELLSRSMSERAVLGQRFQVPEYESAVNAYPRAVRSKEFDLSVYELLPAPTEHDAFTLDVGATDDLYVRRFYAKEQSPAGFTYRWTRDTSFVSIVGLQPSSTTLTLWMGTGGRPPSAPPAVVSVLLGDRPIGSATVGGGLDPYRFEIPADLAAQLGRSDAPASLQLQTQTWSPARVLGGADTRELGVMLDRIDVQ